MACIYGTIQTLVCDAPPGNDAFADPKGEGHRQYIQRDPASAEYDCTAGTFYTPPLRLVGTWRRHDSFWGSLRLVRETLFETSNTAVSLAITANHRTVDPAADHLDALFEQRGRMARPAAAPAP